MISMRSTWSEAMRVSWLLVAGFMRYSSLAALVAAAFAPFFQMMVWGMEPAMACIVPMSLLLIWRHAANIRKLMDGTETKIG
ncbi:MAG: glycerol-3-phosphate acyltransferase, partial [Verrucomicrobiota bacterium]